MPNEYRSSMASAIEELDRRIKANALRIAQQYERNWVKLIRASSPTGRMYRIPGAKRRRYTASAPGQPPAIRTGTLLRSMQHDITKAGPLHYRVRISWHVNYMRFLEWGTSRMAPRPSARPALQMLYSQLRELIASHRVGS